MYQRYPSVGSSSSSYGASSSAYASSSTHAPSGYASSSSSSPAQGQMQMQPWAHGAVAAPSSGPLTIDANRYLAVSVQLVYIGQRGDIPMVGSRVAICDYRGKDIYTTFVHPTAPITNYRTSDTGLQAAHFAHAPHFHGVQNDIAVLCRDKILVGYGIWHFLQVMGMNHPAAHTRDLALFLPFRKTLRSGTMIPLGTLVSQVLRRQIGYGFEHPLEHARASLDLFRSVQDLWEGLIANDSWPSAIPPTNYAKYFT